MSTALAAARAKTKGKRMLREALEGYGEDTFTLSEWNEKKRDAAAQGKWTWKRGVASTNVAVKSRVERDGDAQDALKARFVDLHDAMAQEMSGVLRARGDAAPLLQDDADASQCAWRDRIGGKPFHCTNDVPVDKKGAKAPDAVPSGPQAPGPTAGGTTAKRFCLWHARECTYSDHPMDRSRAIEIPNEFGLCLHCYDATATAQRATLQKTPPRVMAVKVPGVSATDLRRDVQREMLRKTNDRARRGDATGHAMSTATSVCSWAKEHFEKAYIWRCTNRVVMHPTLHGAYLSFCGYHAPRCIREYGRKSKNGDTCPAIERLNAFGMCRNHLESHMSTLSYEARGACVLVDSEFDVPGIRECRRDPLTAVVTRHPLAPKHAPPVDDISSGDSGAVGLAQLSVSGVLAPQSESVVKRALSALAALIVRQAALTASVVLESPNPVSMALKEAIWRIQFLRRARVVATRIQRIFRGNRARRRVRALRYEHAALKRMHACSVLQRFTRGYLGRQRFKHEHDDVYRAVPVIQRIVRGGLARLYCRRLRAAARLQRNYRCYRQRLIAWAFREEMAYMQALQREADANLREMEERLTAFRRLRARRLLRAHMLQWRKQREARARAFALRLQTFWSATKIQRQWRRHQRYERIKKRYQSAQAIQKRVRGWLTRHMWHGDPGVLAITSFINPRSGVEYGKTVVLAQPSRSYAYPSRRIRMSVASLAIQRVFRGHIGRLCANERWVNMLRRWEWTGVGSTDSSGKSSDSMTVGKERYGFLLPSHGYSHDQRLHMKPIVHDIKAARGFAYKYQSILDLIKDRDGLRAWSRTHELREQKKQARLAALEREAKQNSERALAAQLLAPGSALSKPRERRKAGSGGISLPKALFPVGATVRVQVFNTRKRGAAAYQHATVVRIHSSSSSSKSDAEDATTFDVEYNPVLVTVHGVRIYTEQHVPARRLQVITHADLVDPPPERRVSVGRQLQLAINDLKRDIREARQREQQQFLVTADLKHERALDSVDAIAARLRDARPGCDLLADDAAFVNFVFRNSTLLTTAWMHVVDSVRHGPQSGVGASPIHEPTHLSKGLGTPALEFFEREFGFTQQRKDADAAATNKPQPQRAATIERRLIELGFQRSVDVAGDHIVEGRATERGEQRPETTDEGLLKRQLTASRLTRDDSALDEMGKRLQTSQDIHRLIYELKTLPRERRREEIVEITTRNVRAFVCGHPACGRCFSSLEAARLHQKTIHEHKDRLAVGTPLTDQYMHTYWPPQSPWNRETHAQFEHMVGYFRCSRVGCERVEFRTRRELQRHMTHAHGVVVSLAREETCLALEQTQATLLTAARQVVWLGAYSLCRNLNDKLGLPRSLLDVSACETHTRVADTECYKCERAQSCPRVPCKLYSSVALSLPSDQQRLRSSDSDPTGVSESPDASAFDGFTIFSVEDRAFCPTVLQLKLVDARASRDKRRKAKPRAAGRDRTDKRAREESSAVAYIQVTALCRDSNGVDWVLGRSFREPPAAGASAPDAVVHKLETGVHDVVLDERLVFAQLSDVVGAARVQPTPARVFEDQNDRALRIEHGDWRASAAAAHPRVFVAHDVVRCASHPSV